jgi:hypothetical protein
MILGRNGRLDRRGCALEGLNESTKKEKNTQVNFLDINSAAEKRAIGNKFKRRVYLSTVFELFIVVL